MIVRNVFGLRLIFLPQGTLELRCLYGVLDHVVSREVLDLAPGELRNAAKSC